VGVYRGLLFTVLAVLGVLFGCCASVGAAYEGAAVEGVELRVAVPEGVGDYVLLVEGGALLFAWTAPLNVNGDALPSLEGQVHAVVDVYPGFFSLAFNASGEMEAGGAPVTFSVSGFGEGGSLASSLFSGEASGFIASGDMRVLIGVTVSVGVGSSEIVVSLEQESPSSLPLFAASAGFASQVLKEVASRLEESGFAVEVEEDAGVGRYVGTLRFNVPGEARLAAGKAVAQALGAGSPVAPLIAALLLSEPSLLVDEPLVTVDATANVYGGSEPWIRVTGSASSHVAAFDSPLYDAEASTGSVVLRGSQLLVAGVEGALCSIGAAECSGATPPAVSGSYRAVEAALLDEVAVEGGFFEVAGYMKALKPFAVNAGGLKVVLPEGAEATLVGVEVAGEGEPGVYGSTVYGSFSKVIVEAGVPFVAVHSSHSIEAEQLGDVYRAELAGPYSYILSPPEALEYVKPEPVTVTATTTVTETATVTETLRETVTETVTVTVREGGEAEGGGAPPVSAVAVAGAALALGAPILAYLLLVRGR